MPGGVDQLAGLNALPVGTILPWAGDVQHLPQGWFLCNGANGTVDLTNRMPMGLGVGGAVVPGPMPGATGPNTGTVAANPNGPQVDAWVAGHAEVTVEGGEHYHLLPVNAVFFIQRISLS